MKRSWARNSKNSHKPPSSDGWKRQPAQLPPSRATPPKAPQAGPQGTSSCHAPLT
ncbi:MAG: hypothetical protein R3E89_05730 [Thiolinea sp.]